MRYTDSLTKLPGFSRIQFRAPLLFSCCLILLFQPLHSETHFRFKDIAQESGVRFIVNNSETESKYQVEPMIAGVALFDFNNDGLLDIFICNGAEIPSLEKTNPSYYNRLYRNMGGMRFKDVTDEAGVRGAGYSMGAAAGDYNNDGLIDLYVTGVNRNFLYRNMGDGTFSDVTGKTGVEAMIKGHGKAWSVGAGWLDYDNDGDLDLFVVNYCVWSIDKDSRCGAVKPGYRTYCHPKMYAPLPNILYRNNGDETFTDLSNETGVGQYAGKGMGISVADFDLDGDQDVFISNDAWRNFLFNNLGNGTFEEVGMNAGVAYIDSGRPVSGMGSDAGDYDGDGLIDIFMTALSNETFPLYQNLGNWLFRDERFPSGLGIHTLPWGGWSTGMVDFDNDGDLDLFIAGGHVQTNEELYSNRASRQQNRLYENLGTGTFKDVTEDTPGLETIGLHRGAAFGDLDNDGRIDAVVTRLNEPLKVLHNQSALDGSSLSVELRGTKSNRFGVGALLMMTLNDGTQILRHTKTAVGYGGSSDHRVHFGLGKRKPVSLTIDWPGGSKQVVSEFGSGNFLTITESPD
jgi:hypothetical protein